MGKGWGYYAGKLLSKIVCLLPYRLLITGSKVLGGLYYRIADRARERAKEQMMRGLSISAAESEPILKRMFNNVVLNFLEFFYLPNISGKNVHKFVTFEGLHHLDRALQNGKGAIIVTAHLGNWELCALAMNMQGYPMVGIGKQQPNKGFTLLLTEYRSRFGGEVFYKGAALRQVIKSLKENKLVYIVSDQDGGKDGIFIDFLNKPASTPAGPAAFARKCSAPVIPVFLHRTGSRHVLVVDPPLELRETDDVASDVHHNLTIITQRVEEEIRKYPDEWLWFQKRWNTPVEVVEEHEHQR